MDQDPSHSLPSLAGAGWLERAETRAAFAALSAEGHDVRAVGGAVRNTLLGRPVGDIDLSTTARPEEVMAAAEKAGLKSVPTGLDHGTVTVIADGHPFEVTTLREDVETYGRHAQIAFSQDWAADAARRDFTINALYAGADGTLYDPLGGYEDIVARRVRFIGDPHERIREDFLRILRFFRFTAEYAEGAADAEGLWACVSEHEGLKQLSAERVRAELVRLLTAVRGPEIVETMFDYGLLVDFIGTAPALPRFRRLVAAENAFGKKADAARHLGALAVRVREDAERLAVSLRLSKAERQTLETVAAGALPGAAQMGEREARAALYALGEKRFEERMLISVADSHGVDVIHSLAKLITLPSRWSPPVFPLGGEDVQALGVREGPKVGEILKAVEAWWIAQDFPDDRAALEERLRAEAQALG